MSEAVQAGQRMSFAEYVERELRSDVKCEYHAGEVLAMSGGTIDHSRIIRNIARRLSERLEGKPCEPFESNLRVYVRAFDRGVYPDAQVICGPVDYHGSDRTRTTVLNPSVVFEVLSPTTAAYDRGEKLQMYLTIPTLEHYVIVESDKPLVEILSRRAEGWLRTQAAGLEDAVRLPSIQVEVKLAELYLGITFPERSGEPSPDGSTPS